ncbi:hypothetical protein QVD17_09585 [Tagetes erecta]|uniref:Transposase (putative) gypsy type domain-containing protein n=1 Tax=Tagetes erecta TaxID=13708 RepID=A0AAD8L693_TARER|nr:hypothetical protein QVD17_09585 [Tagetes erecta]
MADRHNLAVIRSSLSSGSMLSFCNYYGLMDLHPVLPGPDDSAIPPPGMVTIYQDHFDFACCRYPLSPFLIELLLYYGIHFYQVNPLGLCRPTHFEIACRGLGGVPTVSLFRCFYRLDKSGDWFTFSKRRKPNPFCALDIPDSRKGWKKKFFYVSEDFAALPRGSLGMTVKDPVPAEGSYDAHLFDLLKGNPTPIVVYPEPLLVLAGLSTIRESPRTRPAVFKDGVEMDLFSMLEEDSSKFDWLELPIDVDGNPSVPIFPRQVGAPSDLPQDPVVGDNPPMALEGVGASTFPIPPVHSPINQGSAGHFSYSAGKRPASEEAGPLPSKVRRLNVRFGGSRASGAEASAIKAVPFQSIPVDSDDLSPHDSFDLDNVGFSGTNVITSPGEKPVDSSVNPGTDRGPILAQDPEPFVPSWRLMKGSTFDEPVAVDEFLLRSRPPGERNRLRQMPGSELCEGFGYNLVQNFSHGVEVYRRLRWLEERYVKVLEERDQLQGHLDDRVSSKVAPLEKDLESSRQAVGLMEERLKSQEVRHSDEITAHQVELDSHRVLLERAEVFFVFSFLVLLLQVFFLFWLNCGRLSIFQEHARELERKVAEAEARATLLIREKEDHVRAVEGYEARLKALADNEKKNEERVSSLKSEKQWFLVEGFRSLYSAILRSPGFISLVGNVNMAAMAVGFNKGLVAGAAYAKKDVPIESHPEYDPDARQALKDRAETLQTSEHQLISQLAGCSEKTVEEISGLIARFNASSS